MSRPSIQSIQLTENLTLSECHPDSECRTNNWWLYDERAGMNIGIRATTRDAAFLEAIEYWANRAMESESSHKRIKRRIDAFVSQFIEAECGDD